MRNQNRTGNFEEIQVKFFQHVGTLLKHSRDYAKVASKTHKELLFEKSALDNISVETKLPQAAALFEPSRSHKRDSYSSELKE